MGNRQEILKAKGAYGGLVAVAVRLACHAVRLVSVLTPPFGRRTR
jgi:hypothetical protein